MLRILVYLILYLIMVMFSLSEMVSIFTFDLGNYCEDAFTDYRSITPELFVSHTHTKAQMSKPEVL